MTSAIIGQFYDKFLSLKNEPQINRKTFFIRIVIIGLLTFFSYGLLDEVSWFIFTSPDITFFNYTGWGLISLRSWMYHFMTDSFPMLFSWVFWIIYIMNITIVKRVSDIWSYLLLLLAAAYQIIILGTVASFSTNWGGDGGYWILFAGMIYILSQIILLLLLVVIPWEKPTKKYDILWQQRINWYNLSKNNTIAHIWVIIFTIITSIMCITILADIW